MKSIIVGMNAPHADQVFMPYPPNGSGDRMIKMINDFNVRRGKDPITGDQWVDAFDRVNMHDGKDWNRSIAEQNAPWILHNLNGRTVFVMGKSVMNALGLDFKGWGQWSQFDSDEHDTFFNYVVFPHPSGLTRQYNQVEHRDALASMLVMFGDWK